MIGGLDQGDQILFTAKNKDLGVINGTQAVVEQIKPSRKGGHYITVSIRSETKDNGRRVTFNSHEMKALAHRYAGTVHKSQGQGKREVYHLANLGMLDNHSALVAFTRLTKGSYRMYATSDDVERLNERLGLERLKETILDAGLVKGKGDMAEQVAPTTVQRAERPKTQRPATQRSDIQGKLDALMKEHQEQRQARSQMSENERKARRLLEMFEQRHLVVERQSAASVVAERPGVRLRQGLAH